jgi:hypothetical protein
MDRFSFSFFGKTAIRKTGNLSLACDPDLTESACSLNQISAFWISRNPCHDVRALLLA